MHSPPPVLLAHAAATWLLVGLIWVVQLVHYPLFGYVDRERFSAFETDHARRITWIVAPTMGLELVTGVWLVLTVSPGAARNVLVVGLVLIVALWLSTAVVQMPCHKRLADGYDASVHRRLVLSNWTRTVLWTVRGGLVAWLLDLAA